MSQATTAVTAAHAHGESGHDFAQANKAWFDEHAHNVEEEHPYARPLGIATVNAMRDAHSTLFDKERTEVLDYACGTGLVSQAMLPYVKRIVGVDISQASVDLYNKYAADNGFAPEMSAVSAQLKGEPGELDGAKFDVIICCSAYHHFADIEETTRALAFFLKPGGSLLVTDLMAAPDGRELIPSTHHHVVPHKHGLSEETMRKTFEGAGLVDFEMREIKAKEIELVKEHFKLHGEMVWFLACGVKPAGAA